MPRTGKKKLYKWKDCYTQAANPEQAKRFFEFKFGVKPKRGRLA